MQDAKLMTKVLNKNAKKKHRIINTHDIEVPQIYIALNVILKYN